MPWWAWLLIALFALLAVLALLSWRNPYSFPLSWVATANQLVCRLWYRSRTIGPRTVPAEDPLIITANHGSTADPQLLVAANMHRRISFLIAREYVNTPLASHVIRWIRCIPVRRDGQDVAATKNALRRLKEGDAIVVFIEGGITPPQETPQPKNGVAMLALRSGVPVIPVHISGTKYHEGVLAGVLAHHRARIRFGPPVNLADFGPKPDREAISLATDRIYAAIKSLAPPGPN
jgi:1-acyl-sn-glycerol-3-phosphate acyltransferase